MRCHSAFLRYPHSFSPVGLAETPPRLDSRWVKAVAYKTIHPVTPTAIPTHSTFYHILILRLICSTMVRISLLSYLMSADFPVIGRLSGALVSRLLLPPLFGKQVVSKKLRGTPLPQGSYTAEVLTTTIGTPQTPPRTSATGLWSSSPKTDRLTQVRVSKRAS